MLGLYLLSVPYEHSQLGLELLLLGSFFCVMVAFELSKVILVFITFLNFSTVILASTSVSLNL